LSKLGYGRLQPESGSDTPQPSNAEPKTKIATMPIIMYNNTDQELDGASNSFIIPPIIKLKKPTIATPTTIIVILLNLKAKKIIIINAITDKTLLVVCEFLY